MMAESEQYLVMARIGKTYGVKGWLKIYSHTDPVTNIFEYKPWFIKQGNKWINLEIDDEQQKGNDLLVHVKGYDSPEVAKQLTGLDIVINKKQLPKLSEGEFYWHELIGLEVFTIAEQHLGKVIQVMNNAAHPILEIQGEKKHLVPLVMEKFIHDIDFKEKKIVVNWDPEF